MVSFSIKVTFSVTLTSCSKLSFIMLSFSRNVLFSVISVMFISSSTNDLSMVSFVTFSLSKNDLFSAISEVSSSFVTFDSTKSLHMSQTYFPGTTDSFNSVIFVTFSVLYSRNVLLHSIPAKGSISKYSVYSVSFDLSFTKYFPGTKPIRRSSYLPS